MSRRSYATRIGDIVGVCPRGGIGILPIGISNLVWNSSDRLEAYPTTTRTHFVVANDFESSVSLQVGVVIPVGSLALNCQTAESA